MKITNEILRDLIYCPYKAFNDVSREDAPAEPEISVLFKALKESHFKRYAERNRASSSISFVPKFENENFSLTFDAIDGKSKSNKIAILTVPFESVTKTDKIYIALASHLLYSEFAVKISRCKVVYGDGFKASYLKVSTYKRHILKLIQNLQKIRDNSRAPAFYKNEHCPFCRFFNECNKSLQEKDDLSLLAGLKLKEVASKHSHGIFTVRQLAFTFRARRRSTQARKYRPELKAMAIRDKKTYIQEGWNIPRSEVEVFLDMEGTPDRNLQYLIGMVIRTMGIATTYSFWANGPTEEGQILGDMLSVLSNHKDFIIYHYGAYESKALISLAKRFPEHQESVEWILPKMFNLLSILSQHVYVPTYTNGLKEIGQFLDFKWTDEFATGLQSIVWRYNWEYSKDEAFKQKPLQYNVDDCLALIKVFDWVSGLSMSYPNREVLKEPKPTNVYKWGNTEYAINDFEKVNEKAYFDYQRNHILLRKHKNKFVRRFQDAKPCRVNKATKRISLFPLTCPRCKSKDLKLRPYKKLHIDLLLMSTGVKSAITRYTGGPFQCMKCGLKSTSRNMRSFPKYGRNLMIWSVNQKIQYNLSSHSVINFLRDAVKIEVSPTQMTRFKEVIAMGYNRTYKEILERLVASNLIHVDETIARIKGIDGYVWVLANHECVYYEFRETRETDFLKRLLTPFKGTLVSDFYVGYDSIPCDQQKCLIHLIRDMNADYLKNQFDEEFKFLIVEFGMLLRKIIATIDRYGLKKLHLRKHLNDVQKFNRKVVGKSVESEIARNYHNRLRKYRDSLFHFLTADDIPWNNNNAEHSIKPFAKWRKQKSINLSAANIKNHLILLSIMQTCKYAGVSFFEFLKSGELSVFKFSDTNH